MKTGIIRGIPIDEYHRTDALSNTRLKVFRRMPLLYKKQFLDKTIPPKEGTKATAIGSAADCLLLDGVESYNSQICVHPEYYGPERKDWNWNANVCKEWREQRRGKIILSAEDAGQVEEITQAVLNHPIAAALLNKGEPSVTFRTDWGFAMAQCRSDWVNFDGCTLPDGRKVGPYWVEFKTAASLLDSDFYTFSDAYINQGYYLQKAFYHEIMREVLGFPLEHFFVVGDKIEIPLCQVFDQMQTEKGRDQFEMARMIVSKDVERLAECYSSGSWPSLPQTLQPLEMPRWAEKKLKQEISA